MQRKWKRRWQRAAARLLVPSLAAGVLLLSAYGVGCANPSGGQVVAGAAAITQNGSTMTVTQTTGKVAINWQSFSIAAGEKVLFVQPGASAVALNRVLGSDASRIYGTLTANGKVFLVNPNGVLFAPGAQVSVGGLVASTLNISDADFMAGRYRFSGSGGSIVNQGIIAAADGGYVALLGGTTANEGVIVARRGTVALGAGNAATLDFNGDGLLSLAVDAAAVNAGAANKNLIQADGGLVLMTARTADALAGTVVNNSGVIQARTITNVNGVIRLDGGASGTVANTGTLDASGKNGGQTGGTINVLGNIVSIDGTAKIDAGGDKGGGTILIGGNFQGQGPERNAANTYIGKGVTIAADAITRGNGGKIVVWADNKTEFYGTITARGGTISGDGGQVEVSGKRTLVYQGFTDLRAPQGKTGNLLLDPTDYTIAASGGDITGAALGTQLGSANVTILSSDGGGGVNGDILVSDAVTWSANTTLTLSAYRNINVNADITASGAAAGLVLTPGTGGSGGYSLGNAARITLSGTSPSLTIAGQAYTVISTVDQLQAMNDNLSGRYALGTDIDASATSGWNGGAGFVPVGDANYFVGTFDGLGHTVTGLYINRTSEYIGLFGSAVDATIRNVGLADVNITASSDTTYVGGLVGYKRRGTVANSYSTGAVKGTGDYAGGLVGANSGGTVANSYSSAAVWGKTYVGGLVGAFWAGTVTNSYSTGMVTSNYGGAKAGGLVGYIDIATISNCYSTGAVLGNATRGGLVGEKGSSSASINNSYWNKDTSGRTTSAAGTGRTTAQMLQQGGYSGWNFDSTWAIVEGVSYPYLGWQFSGAPQVVSGTLDVTGGGKAVRAAVNGTLLAKTLTGANGFYYFALPGNSVPSGGVLLTYVDGSATQATAVYLSGGGHITGLGLYSGTLTVGSAGGAVSNATLATAKGGLADDDILYSVAGNNVTVTGAARLTSAGGVTVTGALTASGTVKLAAEGSSDVTLAPGGTVTSGAAGDAVVITAGGRFVNNAGAGAISLPGGGRWLVYSQDPASDTRGGLAYDFKQYNTAYGGAIQGSGNGFVYTVAPAVTVGLTGTVTKTYDGTANATLDATNYTVVAGGAIDGDTIAVSGTGTYDNRNAGTNKTVTVTDSTVNATSATGKPVYGYGISYAGTSADIGVINKAALTITAAANTKTYDGTVSAAAAPTVNGLQAGDTVTGLSQAYADKNAGSGKTLTVTGYTVNDGNGGDNYTVTTVNNASGVIDKATLTAGLTGTVAKTYDGATDATLTGANYTLTGVIGGDAVTVSGTGAYDNKNAGSGKAVAVSGLTLGGADAGNYQLSSTTASGNVGVIDKAALTAGLTGTVAKTYDGATDATLTGANYTLTGVIGGDAVTVSGTGAYDNKNAGSGKAVTVSGLTLGGADAGNYTVNATASANIGEISKAALTAGLTGTVRKPYDGTTTATLSNANYTLTGLVAGDSVAVSGTAAYDTKNIGKNKLVTVTGLTLGGADGGNYTLTSTTASANIGEIGAADSVNSAITAAQHITVAGMPAGTGNFNLSIVSPGINLRGLSFFPGTGRD